MRFAPTEGASDLLQSVAKVYAPRDGPARARAEVLALQYSRSLTAVVLASLLLLGAPVLPSSSPRRPLRILCVGLGGGSFPRFLVEALPHCEVDVAELEPAVLRAATEGMGFVESPRLRVAVGDGGAFAASKAAEAGDDGAYDALVIDAYDADGNVPESLWRVDGDISRALASGLLRSSGVVAINFLGKVDIEAPLAAYSEALGARGGSGLSFSVRQNAGIGDAAWWADLWSTGEVTLDQGNQLALHLRAPDAATLAAALGGDVAAALRRAGREVTGAVDCPWDMAELAARGLRQLKP